MHQHVHALASFSSGNSSDSSAHEAVDVVADDCDASDEWLRTSYFHTRRHQRPYHEGTCSCIDCVYTGRRVQRYRVPPDSVTNFLLNCGRRANMHRCRRHMWQRILALASTHPDAGPFVDGVAAALGWSHPHSAPDVVAPVGAGPRRLLLRIILEGDLTDAMREVYDMDIQRRRMCGPAEVHCFVLEITDEFLCAADMLRSSFEQRWRLA